MDRQDYHLREFSIAGRAYGPPDPEEEHPVLDERAVRLQDLGLSIGDRIEYVYDFGDDWRHVLEVENDLPRGAEAVYPVCVGGECSAPPEDVGGGSGYEEFPEALSDSSPRGARAHEGRGWAPPRSYGLLGHRGQ